MRSQLRHGLAFTSDYCIVACPLVTRGCDSPSLATTAGVRPHSGGARSSALGIGQSITDTVMDCTFLRIEWVSDGDGFWDRVGQSHGGEGDEEVEKFHAGCWREVFAAQAFLLYPRL